MANAQLQAVLLLAVFQASTSHSTVQLESQAILVLDVSIGAVQRSTLGQVVHIAQRQLVSLESRSGNTSDMFFSIAWEISTHLGIKPISYS